MEFIIPTTKEQMYLTLQQIFNYYRVKRIPLEDINLLPISLTRDTFTPLTDDQLLTKAKSLLEYKYLKEKTEKIQALTDEKAELEIKNSNLDAEYLKKQKKVNDEYALSIEKVQLEAKKNGLISSTITVSAIQKLEDSRALKISELVSELEDKKAENSAKITTIESQINSSNTYYASLLEKEVKVKVEELKSEQEKTVRDVFRYNNGLDEKEQRNESSIKQIKANLDIKYAQINANEISKDKLIDLGYYDDVLDCICGYYDNQFATPLEAYQDITNEAKLMVYMDEYYTNLVYIYKLKAEKYVV